MFLKSKRSHSRTEVIYSTQFCKTAQLEYCFLSCAAKPWNDLHVGVFLPHGEEKNQKFVFSKCFFSLLSN